MSDAGKWADLAPRVISALVMLVVAGTAIWLGGVWLLLLLALASAAMAWECARLGAAETGALRDIALPIGAGALFWLGVQIDPPFGLALMSLVGAAIFALSVQLRRRLAIYSFASLMAAAALLAVREQFGVTVLLWLIGVVIASDVMGYFAGRVFGGPKFWPAVSPKKTWSGTVAGWLGAALLGLMMTGALKEAFALEWPLPIWLFSALLAFAAQMGDIVESALKRKAGIKDSSNLIPGHGGVLDRFDALIGASLAFFVIWVLF